MANIFEMGLSIYLITVCLVCVVKSFNIDLGSPYIFKPPSGEKGIYFGYAIALTRAETSTGYGHT